MRPRALLLVVVMLAAAGCGDDDEAAPQERPPASTATTAQAGAGRQVDWKRGYDVEVDGGWRLVPCEAGPRLMCAKLDGTTEGVVELGDFVLDGAVKAALDRGESVRSALDAFVGTFHASFLHDRRQGCGPAYDLETFGPSDAVVGGQTGVSYGFEGRLDGRRVERVVGFATVEADRLFVLSASSAAPGTCMDDQELDELTPEQLDHLEPVLTEIAANSPLPPPQS